LIGHAGLPDRWKPFSSPDAEANAFFGIRDAFSRRICYNGVNGDFIVKIRHLGGA